MNRIASREEIKAYEKHLMEAEHIPSLHLMERAAQSVASFIEEKGFSNILICAGCGNNGADGLAVARILNEVIEKVSVVIVGDRTKCTKEFLFQEELLTHTNVVVSGEEAKNHQYDLIVDAILGIGQNRDILGIIQETVNWINDYRQEHNTKVLAIDMPTGIHTDSGRILTCAVQADYTITFSCKKSGQVLGPGSIVCGDVVIRRIAGAASLSTLCSSITKEDLKNFPKRDVLGNKATFGKVLCITGNCNTPGACILNAKAVLKSGAGMVKVMTDPQNRDLLMTSLPEAMFQDRMSYDDEMLIKETRWSSAAVIGCGLGIHPDNEKLLEKTMKICEVPLIIDADALTILGKHMEWLRKRSKSNQITILTPHPKEFTALFGGECKDKMHANPGYVNQLAREYGCIIVAKDAKTMIADGCGVLINESGNDSLAKAGSGDILSGMIAALVCVCDSPAKACGYAVYLHGLAGAEAGSKIGRISTTANDILETIPLVMKSIM